MNPRLIKYYTKELEHLREMGGEFAKEFPKIAGRLGLDGFECLDPYVERLLEGFAFLAARVQLKLDAEFPRFTQHLLEMVYPEYLSPTPSMAVVQMQPDLTEGGLAEGFVVPRHTVLRSTLGGAMQTPCEYRTGQDVTLWPLELVEVAYSPHAGDLTGIDVPDRSSIKSGIRFRLKTTAGLKFDKLSLDPGTSWRNDINTRLADLLEVDVETPEFAESSLLQSMFHLQEAWVQILGGQLAAARTLIDGVLREHPNHAPAQKAARIVLGTRADEM